MTRTAPGGSASSSAASSPSVSPRNRLKFLCSYGGKILPHPSDDHLRYVGGHTRVLVVTRSISFSELKERIQDMFPCCAAIKYELVAKDMEALVSVTCDEDLAYMLDEYDRLDARQPRFPSSPRFRLFLFSSPSSNLAAAADDDQRLISAASSSATSPTSTIDGQASILALRSNALTANDGGGGTHRVRSAPNLRGGGLLSQIANGAAGQYHHNHPEQHLLRRQKSSGASSYGSRAAGGSGAPRVCGAKLHEVCRCGGGCRVTWVPQPAALAGFHYSERRAMCFGHA
ncbi:hypothetical protein OPV22_034999 [Ensete ventricosum]|uniref:PB1 domain-containing protein n=1 Tax=Ensete ventricosum TaxID=4639 RepID=A0AAV8PKE4_ENSVE|nr:hypothetical protein OPV22_034999 [Ensete ventricosum]